MPASYPCRQPGCPQLLAAAGYCPQHRADADATRPRNDYGTAHQRRRRAALASLNAGRPVYCWRCYSPILTAADLVIGHDDQNPTITRGPEHARCNALAAVARRRDNPRPRDA